MMTKVTIPEYMRMVAQAQLTEAMTYRILPTVVARMFEV
jgi:hypothetical protein